MKKTFCDRCGADITKSDNSVKGADTCNQKFVAPGAHFVFVGSDGRDYCHPCIADIVLGKEWIDEMPASEAQCNR